MHQGNWDGGTYLPDCMISHFRIQYLTPTLFLHPPPYMVGYSGEQKCWTTDQIFRIVQVLEKMGIQWDSTSGTDVPLESLW